MIYKTIRKFPLRNNLGGLYQILDRTVYQMNHENIRRCYVGPTTVLNQNASDKLRFDDSTFGLIINLDSNGQADIGIYAIKDVVSGGKKIRLDVRGKCKFSNKSLDGLSFPATAAYLENFLGNGPGFDVNRIEFSTTDIKDKYFILSTSADDICVGYITYIGTTSKEWCIRYQTWRVRGCSDLQNWGASAPAGFAHSRMTGIETVGPMQALIVTNSDIELYAKMFPHGVPTEGRLGQFPDHSDAIKIYTSMTKERPIAQIVAHEGFTFYIEGSSIRVLRLSPPGTHAILPLMLDSKNPMGLLVRHDPAYARERVGRIQLIVADAGSGTTLPVSPPRLWLLTANIEDPAKLESTLTALPVKDLIDPLTPYGLVDFWDLTWANEECTAFYMPEPSKNRVARVSISQDGKSATVEASCNGIPMPRTVLVAGLDQLYVICKEEIGDLRVNAEFDTDAYDVLGIGLIPFRVKASPGSTPPDKSIVNESTGIADTYPLKNWPLYVKDVPFADTISLMINHTRLYANHIRWYEVYFLGPEDPVTKARPRYTVNEPFGDLYNGAQRSTTTDSGKYPVRETPLDWYYPHLGALIDTRTVLHGNSGLFELHVDFYDLDRNLIGTPFKHSIYVDNRKPWIELDKPTVWVASESVSTQIDDCGSMRYCKKDEDILSFKYLMRLDGGGFSGVISTYCGNRYVPEISKSVTPSASTSEVSETMKTSIDNVLKMCPTALIRISASVAVQVTNGYSSYPHSARDSAYFALYGECKKP